MNSEASHVLFGNGKAAILTRRDRGHRRCGCVMRDGGYCSVMRDGGYCSVMRDGGYCSVMRSGASCCIMRNGGYCCVPLNGMHCCIMRSGVYYGERGRFRPRCRCRKNAHLSRNKQNPLEFTVSQTGEVRRSVRFSGSSTESSMSSEWPRFPPKRRGERGRSKQREATLSS